MKQPFDSQMVTRLVSNVGVPSLVFSTLVAVEIDSGIFMDMAAAALLTQRVLFRHRLCHSENDRTADPDISEPDRLREYGEYGAPAVSASLWRAKVSRWVSLISSSM